jgi:alcohol dehydrogenase YqhD (iron-dependent ADH family)
MENFEFLLKTKIYFGRDEEKRVGEIISSYGYKKVLLLLGGGSARKSGLFNSITDSLEKASLEVLLLEGIRPNPEFDFVRRYINEVKDFKPDIILAVGGGSVIDTAKSIAVSYFYDGDGFDFNLHKVNPSKALSIGVVLTISAAGSEAAGKLKLRRDRHAACRPGGRV